MAKKKATKTSKRPAKKTGQRSRKQASTSRKKASTKKKASKRKASKAKRAGSKPSAAEATGLAGYEQHREQARARQAEQARSGRDIGELPAVVDPERRAGCKRDFRRFARTYFAHHFWLPWAEPHELAAERLQTVTLEGGLFALAMPRGWGKTTLCEVALIWAIVYGHRRYVVYVGNTVRDAKKRLEEIKTEFENNDVLLADFPEVCYPIRKIAGITQRSKGQLYKGERTNVGWTGRQLVLPTIPGSPAAGSVIDTGGMSASIRGLKWTTPQGETLRPDLVVGDDPQDEESAQSPSAVKKRLNIVNGAMLEMAGPGRRIAAFVPCTVIQKDDLADRLLDRKRNPQWRGQRTQALKAFPTDDKKWDEYAQARADGLRAEDDGEAANAFYRKHQPELEEGAEVVWQENVIEGDVSALQSLMNKKIDQPDTFWAEQQQQPPDQDEASDTKLTAELLESRIIAPGRGVVPNQLSRLTAFIDPSTKVLWWMLCAWGDDFTGRVVAYGAWPDQGLSYFTAREAKRTLARKFPGAGRQAMIYQGLQQLVGELLEHNWKMADGTSLPVERCLVDAGLGEISDTVRQFCRESSHAAQLRPSFGRYVGPGDKAIAEWSKQSGDRVGHHWRERSGKQGRFLIFDANRWKTFIAERFRVQHPDPGSLTIYKDQPSRHRLLSDHMVAEYPIPTEQRGRRMDVWKQLPNKDNDLFDCLVGNAVAASTLGVATTGHQAAPGNKRRRRKKKVEYL